MEWSKNSENPCRFLIVVETVNSKNVVFIVISERHINGMLIWAYIYCCFWDREIIFVKKALYVEQKSSLTSLAANLGYEIPALLYSLLKPTRTLIAKAIGRQKQGNATPEGFLIARFAFVVVLPILCNARVRGGRTKPPD